MPETSQGMPLHEARSALLNSPHFALRELVVEQIGRQLMLSGTVSTFYHKQIAQEVVRSFADGMQVVNQVDVVDYESSQGGTPADEAACASP